MGIDPGSIEFDTYELVLLRRTSQSREFDEETQERIFREHAAYTIGLGARGDVLAAGPVTESKAEDQPLTGFGIYQKGSHEKVRELLAKDPGVLGGQYTFEIMTWLTPKAVSPSAALPAAAQRAEGSPQFGVTGREWHARAGKRVASTQPVWISRKARGLRAIRSLRGPVWRGQVPRAAGARWP